MSNLGKNARNLLTLVNNFFAGISPGTDMSVSASSVDVKQAALGEFSKALVKGVAGQLFRRREKLLIYDDILRTGSYYGRHETGILSVPIDQIVGSVGRGREFDAQFYPLDEHLEQRWVSVWSARMHGLGLGPVSLYKIGEVYFVEDGHHRISVARSLGQTEIEAQVVELHFEDIRLPVTSTATPGGLLGSVVMVYT